MSFDLRQAFKALDIAGPSAQDLGQLRGVL